MQHKLSKYIIPSVISMVLIGTYTNIDGFFIGNAAGDDGLAAINIVWPIVAFITALGTGLGVGGSVMLNNMRGANKHLEAEQVKRTLLWLLVVLGLFVSVVLCTVYTPILKAMGADGIVLEYSQNYSIIVCSGAIFQIIGAGMLVLFRNENRTYLSMIFSIVGLIIHLVLDILLAGKYKLFGVAISTVISQAVITILGFIFIRTEKGKWINIRYVFDMLKRATAPFGINFVSSVVLMFTNYYALKAGGTSAVSAYAVMSYAVYTFDYIFQGVCDGVQPVISFCNGANDCPGEKHTVLCGGWIIGIIAVVCILLTPVLISTIPSLFAVSKEAERMMTSGFVIYALSYPFKAMVKYTASYYYAIGKTTFSNVITYLDPLFLTPIMLVVLPKLFGLNGIWMAMTSVQIILSLIAIVVIVLNKNKERVFKYNNKKIS